jgi:hypothetical protein
MTDRYFGAKTSQSDVWGSIAITLMAPERCLECNRFVLDSWHSNRDTAANLSNHA